jgi:uncharacterized coiled-coil DUF342 family protein
MTREEFILALVVAVFSSGGTGSLLYFLEFRQRQKLATSNARKVEAEAISTEADAGSKTLEGAFKLINEFRTELDRVKLELSNLRCMYEELEKRSTRLSEYIRKLLNGIGRLHQQIIDLKAIPVWKPPAPPEGVEE